MSSAHAVVKRRPSLVGLLAAVAIAACAMLPAASEAATDPLLAPASVCAGSDALTVLSGDQSGAMMCLIDYARAATASGLAVLNRPAELASSSGIKADDIVRCKDFSHTACGRSADAAFVQAGYITPTMPRLVNENLATGSALDTPRSIMAIWLGNDAHRQTLLDPGWRDQGVALRRPGLVPGLTDDFIWVSHFGSGDVGAGGGSAGRQAGGGAGGASGQVPGAGGSVAASSVRLSVRPSRVRRGRLVRFHFVLKGRPAGSRLALTRRTVHFAGAIARTDARGHATIVVRLQRAGIVRADIAIGKLHGHANVRVVRR